MPAAGISSGARPCASMASAIARSGSASSAAWACAVSSTARRRSATGLSIWPLRLAIASVSSAPAQSACRHCRSNSASADQPSFGLSDSARSAYWRAASISPSRSASRNRPRRPSCSVSGLASMASKIRRAVARSPESWAAWARSRCVSGSFGSALRAWIAYRVASARSPAPIAIMPEDSNSRPRLLRRLRKKLPILAGLCQMWRMIEASSSVAASSSAIAITAWNTVGFAV